MNDTATAQASVSKFFDHLIKSGIDEESAAFMAGRLSQKAMTIVYDHCQEAFTKDEWKKLDAMPFEEKWTELDKQYFDKKKVRVSDLLDHATTQIVEKFEAA